MEPQAPQFLRLSGELRNRIYRLVLTEGMTAITITREEIGRRTALLKVCQTTRREGTSVFLQENRFQADAATDNYDHIVTWLRLLEPTHAKRVVIAIKPVASAMDIKFARTPNAEPPATLTERTWHHLVDYSVARQIMAIDLAHALKVSGVHLVPCRMDYGVQSARQPMWGSAARVRWYFDLLFRMEDVGAGRQTIIYSMDEMCDRFETKMFELLRRANPATAALLRRLLDVPDPD